MPTRASTPAHPEEHRRVARALLGVARGAGPWERVAYLRLAAGLIGELHPAATARLLRLADTLIAEHFPDARLPSQLAHGMSDPAPVCSTLACPWRKVGTSTGDGA